MSPTYAPDCWPELRDIDKTLICPVKIIEAEPLLRGINLLIRMRCGNMEFIDSMLQNGIPHHNGIVYGDILDELKEYAYLMDIPIIIK